MFTKDIGRNELVIVALSARIDEAALNAASGEFYELAAALERGAGQFDLVTTKSVAPYDVAVRELCITTTSTTTARISVDRTSLIMSITGPVEHLVTLAAIMRGMPGAEDSTEHIHLEYHPGHYFLAEDSFPLVIALSGS